MFYQPIQTCGQEQSTPMPEKNGNRHRVKNPVNGKARRKAGGRNGAPAAPTAATLPAVVNKVELPVGFHPGEASRWTRIWRAVIGAPRNIWDRSLFRHIALIPLLAWVGMGADGLSSSCYGPEQAYLALGSARFVAVLVAIATAATVVIICMAYSEIIESFPHGGGGYVVASKLLGPASGVVSGSALIIDYMLTIAVSVAAGGDAFFSLLPGAFQPMKVPAEVLVIALLAMINLRGVKESVMTVAPVFFIFIATHIALLGGAMWMHADGVVGTVSEVADGWKTGLGTIGFWGIFFVFLRSYSMGAGTYTGLEAVSNGLSIMREPRVANGKRTMTYMAISLSVLSAGLLISYLAVGVRFIPGQTLNASLARTVLMEWLPGSPGTVMLLMGLTLLSEAGLLVIAAQTGFIGGPRVLANMAVDSWLPKRFAALSERLTVRNGVVLYGVGSGLVMLYAGGNIHTLVVMYSINVFITFILSMLSLAKMWIRRKGEVVGRFSKVFTPVVGLVLCIGILAVMIWDKFAEGGWLTLAATGAFCLLCFYIHGYYRRVRARVRKLDETLKGVIPRNEPVKDKLDPDKPTAIMLVENFGGPGVHSLYTLFFKYFPGHFRNVVFVSVGVVDSGNFKGVGALEDLREHVEADLRKYVDLARRMGIPATYRFEVGPEVIEPVVRMCLEVAKEFRRSMVFGGKLVFQKPNWHHALLHDQTATAIQNHLAWEGLPMSILPVRLFD
jgi:amino acid transporter